MIEKKSIIDQQIDYYRKRAPEYDQWFLREGRYDRGDEQRQAWFREIATLEEGPSRKVTSLNWPVAPAFGLSISLPRLQR